MKQCHPEPDGERRESTGTVHSHARRVIQAGATEQEICHSLLLLISTIGFPKVAAALSRVREILDKK